MFPNSVTPRALSYRVTGNAATWLISNSPGVLRRLVFGNTSGTSFTIYDSNTGSGATLLVVTTAAAAMGGWVVDIPFVNGLTIVTVGNGLDLTVVYE